MLFPRGTIEEKALLTTTGTTDETVEQPPPSAGSRTARRRRALLGVALGAGLVAVGGVGAATLVKSPAERAAQTAPPPNSLLTAPVVSQVLTPSIAVRAVVYPPAQYNVVPAAASTEVTGLFVSKLGVKQGDTIAAGELLAEVSGQPLFALPGPVPAYRDLKPGSTGPDVAELQDALAGLGHGSGDDDKGAYGPGTAAAVSDFYRGLGYPVPTTGATTQQAVDTAQKAVDADRQTVDSLTAQKKAGAAAPPQTPPPSQQAQQSQQPQTGDLDQQLANARKQLAADQAALGKARAVNGPMVPAAHVLFLPALPATVTAVNGAVGSPVSGTLLSLTSGGLAVTGQLTPAQAAGVKPGMTVELLAEDTNTTIPGTVAELGAPTTAPPAGKMITLGGSAAPGAGSGPAQPGAAGPAAGVPNNQPGGQSYVPVTIVPDTPLSAAMNGKNVRLTVLKAKAGAPVTAVPIAAISTNAAGRTSVTTVDTAGGRTTVPVTTGVTADGMVAVTPADGARLRAGDQVVVGK
ncbi:peptidoglycan-binding protein [Streptomyces kaniharaensis]|uniref:Peptidoglycan-binding protein n=1 Tax=Streptomyces kaniharaensis TaxID=212423 RepID=A0A6N7KR74_9ACTN|nr:peptidoglycan-binding domain-containing protein [Streptomyces kaniharaensis]MQS13069.1 peptidoglycan-binding protein [Streptomyces kaniharaensis]